MIARADDEAHDVASRLARKPEGAILPGILVQYCHMLSYIIQEVPQYPGIPCIIQVCPQNLSTIMPSIPGYPILSWNVPRWQLAVHE